MVFHDGFRWETGTDWTPYLIYFRDCLSLKVNYFDIGYGILSMLIRSITNEYSIFLIIHALLIYLLFFDCFKKYSVNPFDIVNFLWIDAELYGNE